MPDLSNNNSNASNANNGDGANQNQNTQNQSNSANSGKGTQGELNLSEEQWAKVFDHPRFKTLVEGKNTAESTLKKMQEDAEKQKQKDLEENGKFKDLYEKLNGDNENLKKENMQIRKENAVVTEALKQGVTDTEAVVKLLDMDSVKLSDSGKVENAEQVVKDLITAKPYLVGNTQQNANVGAGDATNSNSNTGKHIYKKSEFAKLVSDTKWLKENKEEAYSALREGRVVKDTQVQS